MSAAEAVAAKMPNSIIRDRRMTNSFFIKAPSFLIIA